MSKKQTDYTNAAFQAIYEKAKQDQAPQLAAYTPIEESTLLARIGAALRPFYDRAIEAVSKNRQRASAELDADAISRGMGSSTFVTDVKQRQQNEAQQDVLDLEREYGARLSEQLYKAMEGERERQLEVEKFNAQQMNEANERAFAVAQVLYSAYLSGQRKKAAAQTAQTGQTPLGVAVAQARGTLNQAGNPNGAGLMRADAQGIWEAMYSERPKSVLSALRILQGAQDK